MKELVWVGSSYEDLKEFPPTVLHAIGYALHHAQIGQVHERIKVLSAKALYKSLTQGKK